MSGVWGRCFIGWYFVDFFFLGVSNGRILGGEKVGVVIFWERQFGGFDGGLGLGWFEWNFGFVMVVCGFVCFGLRFFILGLVYFIGFIVGL